MNQTFCMYLDEKTLIAITYKTEVVIPECELLSSENSYQSLSLQLPHTHERCGWYTHILESRQCQHLIQKYAVTQRIFKLLVEKCIKITYTCIFMTYSQNIYIKKKGKWVGDHYWDQLLFCLHILYLSLQILQSGLIWNFHLPYTSQFCHIAATHRWWMTCFTCSHNIQHLLISVVAVSLIKICFCVFGIQMQPHRQLEKTLTEKKKKQQLKKGKVISHEFHNSPAKIKTFKYLWRQVSFCDN